MKNVLDKSVSFFKNKWCKTPSAKMNLYHLLTSSSFRFRIEMLRRETDEKKRQGHKGMLPCYTPSGLFTTTGGYSLVESTGLICLDIDKKDNIDMPDFENLKKRLASLSYVAYCGLSCSGKGYFCIIPIADAGKLKAHFRSLQKTFHEMGITIDPNCNEINRRRFVSFDPEPYINTEAETYQGIEVVATRKDVEPPENSIDYNQLLQVISIIEYEDIDITDTRAKWFEIGCAFANELGETGRELFHTVSQFYPRYNYAETDRLFDDVLKHRYNYTLGTFYHYAREAGVMGYLMFDPISEQNE